MCLLRCPKFPARCSLTKFRPLPLAQLAVSATGGARIAPPSRAHLDRYSKVSGCFLPFLKHLPAMGRGIRKGAHLLLAPLTSASFGTFLAETRKVRQILLRDKLESAPQERIGQAQWRAENCRPDRLALLRAKSRLRRLRSVQACGPSARGGIPTNLHAIQKK